MPLSRGEAAAARRGWGREASRLQTFLGRGGGAGSWSRVTAHQRPLPRLPDSGTRRAWLYTTLPERLSSGPLSRLVVLSFAESEDAHNTIYRRGFESSQRGRCWPSGRST